MNFRWVISWIVVVFFLNQSISHAGYEIIIKEDGKHYLCLEKQVVGEEVPPITIGEIQRFLEKHGSYGTQVLFRFYNKSVLTEIGLTLKTQECVSEKEIRSILNERLKTAPRVAGVTLLLVTGVVLWNYGNSLIPESIPEKWQFLTPTAPTLAFIGSSVLLAPLTIPLSSWLQKKVFSLFSQKETEKAANEIKEDESEFTGEWLNMQKKLSMNGQIGRNTMVQAFGFLRDEINQMALQMPQDPLLQRSFVIRRIAYFMRTYRYFYREMEPWCLMLSLNMPEKLSVYETLLSGENVQFELMEILRKIDESFDSSYYEKMIHAWMPGSLVCHSVNNKEPLLGYQQVIVTGIDQKENDHFLSDAN